jgi:hypothetical protein
MICILEEFVFAEYAVRGPVETIILDDAGCGGCFDPSFTMGMKGVPYIDHHQQHYEE